MHEPGDILVAYDRDGHWLGSYLYLRDDPETPGWIIVRDMAECSEREDLRATLRVRADILVRPHVVGVSDDPDRPVATVPDATTVQAEEGPRISDAQRRLLFALGKSRGLDLDGLRAMTPAGSISALTAAQASAVIDRLKGSREAGTSARDQGSAPRGQLGMIGHLRDLLGFTGPEFSGWLLKRFKVGSIGEINDSRLASRIIGGMVRMLENRQLDRSRAARQTAFNG